MKISAISHAFNKKLMPLVTTVAMTVPMKTADSTARLSALMQENIVATLNKIDVNDLAGLKIIKTVNFKGGVTHKFDSASVEVLKNRIKRPEKCREFFLILAQIVPCNRDLLVYILYNRLGGKNIQNRVASVNCLLLIDIEAFLNHLI